MLKHLTVEQVQTVIELASVADREDQILAARHGVGSTINVTDENVLQYAVEPRPSQDTLRQFVTGLTDDERFELQAMIWLGRGDYEASDFSYGVDHARKTKSEGDVDYILEKPLADYLPNAASIMGLRLGA